MVKEITIKIVLDSGAGEAELEGSKVLVHEVEVAPPEAPGAAPEPEIPPLPVVDAMTAEAIPEIVPPLGNVEAADEGVDLIPPVPEADPENGPARPARRRRAPSSTDEPAPPG